MTLQALFCRLCRRLGLMAVAAALTAALSPCPGTAAEPSAGTPPLTLLAGRAVQPDGTLKDDVAVLIEDGKIKNVVSASEAQGEQARRFRPDTVLCPGLIDLFSSIGAVGQAVQTVSFVDPDASAADGAGSKGRSHVERRQPDLGRRATQVSQPASPGPPIGIFVNPATEFSCRNPRLAARKVIDKQHPQVRTTVVAKSWMDPRLCPICRAFAIGRSGDGPCVAQQVIGVASESRATTWSASCWG